MGKLALALKTYLVDFPTTQFLVVVAAVLFACTGTLLTLAIIVRTLYELGTAHVLGWNTAYTELLGLWLDKVLILSGIAGLTVVGKRAATKADVIRAEAETP